MRVRLVITLGAAALIAAALLVQRGMLARPSGPEPTPPAATPAAAAADTRLDVPCLRPDVRLLQAVGEVHHLLTRTPYEPAVARFDRGRWLIIHREVEVGSVPELPDFDDMTRLLSGWAGRLGVRSAFPMQPPSENVAPAQQQLLDMHPVLAAFECDRLAGRDRRNAELLALGARALVMIELETTDQVGIADRVAARALALVSACRAVDSTAVSRETCLLAHRMGYGACAWAAAGRLAGDDPVRLFVRQEDARLAAAATAHGATREACFLHLLRLARTRDPVRWGAWLDRAYHDDEATSLPVLGTGFTVGKFETQVPAAYAVFLAVAGELRMLDALVGPDAATGEAPAIGTFVREFEGILDRMPARADGVFLDRDVLRAYYRGSFYTALWAIGEHYRRALSSLPATRDFATELAGLPEGPAGEFGRWYTHLADSKAGHPSTTELRKDLERLPSFGAPLLLRSFEEIRDLSRYASIQPRLAGVTLARHLDTRPAHRWEFSMIAGRDLLMLPLAEDLLASAAQAASPVDPETQGWWARVSDDRPRLETLLAQPDLTAGQQAVLLASLRGVSGSDSASLCAAYQRCIVQHPESWRLVSDFADYASTELKAYQLSRAAVERWLARNRGRDDLEVVIATVTLARTYEREGRWKDELRIASPIASSQQFGAMARTAVALDRVGRGAEAETLAMFAWQRYPDNAEAQSLVAEIFWRHGKHDRAAEVLANPRYPLSASDWRWTLAPHFVDCFGDHAEEALKAVDALSKTRLDGPSTVGELASGCGSEGRHDLAFEVARRVRADGMERIRQLCASYFQLKRWKGQPEGLDWIRPRMAPLGAAERSLVGYLAFANGDAELLWALDPVPPGADGEFQWLLRAAAALRVRDDDPAHEHALAAYFAPASKDRYRTLGRYLRGLEPDSVVLALADGRKHECEAFYYLGLKAQSEGRYREAAECYGRSVATNQSHDGEYYWAYGQLVEWQGRYRTLAKLSERDRRERPGSLVAGAAAAAGAHHD
jgi:tetratricopeptide (TPR) repeat protein